MYHILYYTCIHIYGCVYVCVFGVCHSHETLISQPIHNGVVFLSMQAIQGTFMHMAYIYIYISAFPFYINISLFLAEVVLLLDV